MFQVCNTLIKNLQMTLATLIEALIYKKIESFYDTDFKPIHKCLQMYFKQ